MDGTAFECTAPARSMRGCIAAAALIAGPALAACGADSQGEAEREPSSPGSSPTDVQVGSGAFDLVVELSDGPDWLAKGFGSLWVKRDDGSVVRISPTGEVEATIDADVYQPPVCQGIGISEDAVWACATGGKLIRIDPATNEIIATVEVPKIKRAGTVDLQWRAAVAAHR